MSISLTWDLDYTGLSKKSIYIMRYLFPLFLNENMSRVDRKTVANQTVVFPNT